MVKRKLRIFLITTGLLMILLIGYFIYMQFKPDIQLLVNPQASKKALLSAVRSHGTLTALLLIGLMTVMSAVPGVPTAFLSVFVGVSYGPLMGSCINVLGNTFGNLLMILIIKRFHIFDHETKSNHWVQEITRMKHPKIGVLCGYLVPVIPTFFVNFTVDHLNFSFYEKFLVIFLGVLPASVLYAFGGEALFRGHFQVILILVISAVVLVALIMIIYKRWASHHAKNEQQKTAT